MKAGNLSQLTSIRPGTPEIIGIFHSMPEHLGGLPSANQSSTTLPRRGLDTALAPMQAAGGVWVSNAGDGGGSDDYVNIGIVPRRQRKIESSHYCTFSTATFSKRRKIGAI